MYLNNFSVRIPEGVETQSQYVEMRHRQKYSISLRNNRDVRCDADIVIDGKLVGTWRIEAGESIRLERPADEAKKFTFYKADSEEGQQVEADNVDKQEKGLVEVIFRPEMKIVPLMRVQEPQPWQTTWDSTWYTTIDGGACDNNVPISTYYSSEASAEPKITATRSADIGRKNYGEGVTGLSGHSNQQFNTTFSLVYDEAETTIIHLRLVAVEDERQNPQPLRAVRNSTDVPPPIYC